jgi:hypothetical protein
MGKAHLSEKGEALPEIAYRVSLPHDLPVCRSLHKWCNSLKVVLGLRLIPGSVLVCINRTQRVRVLEVPGVLAIAGEISRGTDSPLKAEVEALRSGLYLPPAEPYSLLTAGQRARI